MSLLVTGFLPAVVVFPSFSKLTPFFSKPLFGKGFFQRGTPPRDMVFFFRGRVLVQVCAPCHGALWL